MPICAYCKKEIVGYDYDSHGSRYIWFSHKLPEECVAGLHLEIEQLLIRMLELEDRLHQSESSHHLFVSAGDDLTERQELEDEIIQLKVRVAELEALNRILPEPIMDLFVELKHGPAGKILDYLQDGRISRGKAAEALAEIAYGREPQLPEPKESVFGNY